MKKVLCLFLITLLAFSSCAEQELNADDPRIQELYAYSKSQADIILALVTDDQFEEVPFVDNMHVFDEMFDRMKNAPPVQACFIRKTGTDVYSTPFDYAEFYKTTPSSLCFNGISLVNDNFSLPSISKIAEYSATYGYVPDIKDMPDVMYLLLMYGRDLPQIVTAFYEVEEDTYITKTSLVYNSGYEIIGSIYLAVIMTADNIWNGIDRFFWNP